MIAWRRRSDGFDWHKHVRTTIRLKRADRRRRIEDARVAAVDGLKDAGRIGVEVGSSGAVLAGHWVKTGAGGMQAGLVRLIKAVPPACAQAWQALVASLRAACGPIQRRGVQPLLLAVSVVLTGAALILFAANGLSLQAALMLIVGFATLLCASLPILFGVQELPRRSISDAVAWLSAKIQALPTPALPPMRWPNSLPRPRNIHLPRAISGKSGAEIASIAVAVLILASATLGGGWLLWRGANLLAGSTGAVSLFAKTIDGRAVAATGDVLRIGDTEVRLAGIEAPDMDQLCSGPGNRRWRCGRDARSALARTVRGGAVSCTVSGTDGGGREVGTCTIGNQDIAETLVREGHVFADTSYFSKYAAIEQDARAQKAGIWRGTAERPAEYRAKAAERMKRAWEQAARSAPGGCPIKGRIASGKKFYALPGSVDYARIRIRTNRGERWFCSEEEALAAGWKPAPRTP